MNLHEIRPALTSAQKIARALEYINDRAVGYYEVRPTNAEENPFDFRHTGAWMPLRRQLCDMWLDQYNQHEAAIQARLSS